MKRTPLRARSRKRQADMVKRRKLVADLLARFPLCQRCTARPSCDVHEIKNRSAGGDFLDPRQCVALCRQCHDWVTTNPAAAHEEGWTRFSWEELLGEYPTEDAECPQCGGLALLTHIGLTGHVCPTCGWAS